MTHAFRPPSSPPLVLPRAPDEETWNAMTEHAQDRAIADILATLETLREAMSEGTRHSRPKARALTTLSDFFERARRRVFLASELAVIYPGQEVFVPDVLAVLDTDPEKEVDSWVVAREKRGIDFVLELRNLGKKHKDMVENVRDFARHGIREYFTFDVRQKVLRGFRLSEQGKAYVPVLGQGGRLFSSVLDLELAVVDGRLRFFHDMAKVLDSGELVTLLEGMVSERDARLEEAETLAEREAERAQKEAERAQKEAERAQKEAERAQKEAERADAAEAELAALRAKFAPESTKT